jgi:hypothetical protein
MPYRYRRDNREPRPYSVTLTCGHRVRTRLEPLSGNARFACRAGLGCGYQLGWIEWTYTGPARPAGALTTGTNPSPQPV